MNASDHVHDSCSNEGCVRPAEPGESYCSSCGLERSLYDREARQRRAQASPGRSREERRG